LVTGHDFREFITWRYRGGNSCPSPSHAPSPPSLEEQGSDLSCERPPPRPPAAGGECAEPGCRATIVTFSNEKSGNDFREGDTVTIAESLPVSAE